MASCIVSHSQGRCSRWLSLGFMSIKTADNRKPREMISIIGGIAFGWMLIRQCCWILAQQCSPTSTLLNKLPDQGLSGWAVLYQCPSILFEAIHSRAEAHTHTHTLSAHEQAIPFSLLLFTGRALALLVVAEGWLCAGRVEWRGSRIYGLSMLRWTLQILVISKKHTFWWERKIE